MNSTIKTGYPSKDKPWMKYYTFGEEKMKIPAGSMYDYIVENNRGRTKECLISYFGKKISVDRFTNEVKKAASAFIKSGIREGDIVTLMSLVTPECLYSIYGLNYIGAIVNSVYISMSDEEIIETINSTESKLLIVLDVIGERIDKIAKQLRVEKIIILSVKDSLPQTVKALYVVKNKKKYFRSEKIVNFYDLYNSAQICDVEARHAGNSDSTAFIVYTSGSTGEPKGVMLSNGNVNSIALQYMNIMEFKSGESFMCFIPPFFSIGFCLATHMPLVLGLKVVIFPDPTPENVSKEFLKIKPNHYVGVPSNILQIIELHKKSLTFIKTFAAGGQSATKEQVDRVNAILNEEGSSARMITGYGMTEFSGTVTTERNDIYKRGSIGIPLPLVNVKVVDIDTRAEKGYNQVGELLFSSPGQMQGYYKNDDATSEIEKIEEDGVKWIKTGDLGYIDEDGFVFFEGRLKRIYLKKGQDGTIYKIFPQRVEELLSGEDVVTECAVIVKENHNSENIQIAYVAVSQFDKDYERLLYKICEDNLPEFMVPEKINVIKQLPKLKNGKIDYQSLENNYQ